MQHDFFFTLLTINWVNKTTSKKEIIKTICDSVNHTRFPKENHLPDWARRDNKVTQDDRVDEDLYGERSPAKRVPMQLRKKV